MTATIDAVRKSVLVAAEPERAFRVFTEEMGRWWPMDSHHLLEQPSKTVVLERSEGGRWYERDRDGNESTWGHVLLWKPPHRAVLTWEVDAEWNSNPECRSEIEVTFTAEGDGTRVEVVHRNLDVYGDRAGEMAAAFSSDNGWSHLLERYAASVAERSGK